VHGSDPAGPRESSSRARQCRAALAALALLAACGVPPRQTAPPARAPEPAAANGPHYRIDPARSELRILVYRAGPLARLGHNHVLVSRALEGEVVLAAAGALDGARFAVRAPVASVVVDDAAARREEGDEFAIAPSAADIEGTRRNLLGPAVLNAAACPALAVSGTTAGGPDTAVATATIDDCGRGTTLTVPLESRLHEGELTVRGGFSVRQTELGLVPFSLALGALSVRDELEVRFALVAVPAGPG
jgi:hypothetical protein